MGIFDQRDFYMSFREFDSQKIEASLESENPLVRLFAVLDRRIGKRRLLNMKDKMEREPDWLKTFYFLRLTAEGVDRF